MWVWFIIWVIILWLLLSSGSYYGYRRSYYRGSALWGVLVLWIILLIIAFAWVGPYWGWYGWW